MQRFIGLFPVLAVAAILAALAGPVLAADHTDGVLLDIFEGRSPGDLDLLWTSGVPEYTVFMSENARSVLDPSNEVLTTANQTATIATPSVPLLFFKGALGGFAADG